ADIKAWANATGNQYVGTVEEEGILKHYLRKATAEEEKQENKHPHVIDLEGLRQKIEGNEKITILDVREPAEYAFGHIPGAKHIPLGELEERLKELNKEDDLYLVCRTGNRSDYAAQVLTKKGFNKVTNVSPGMSNWEGPIEK
ncbi:MAG TPA: rhodanese-like domain-containing protein, partial [Sporolactobacillaceae bacterium]|nr:rhodanese-like domain-containing protein [Sporolactobacillaceae bacterium]